MNQISLYHGTDTRIIKMKKEEREQYLKDCNLVIDSLFPYYKPLLQWEEVNIMVDGKTVVAHQYGLKKYEKILNEKGGQFMYVNLYEKLTMLDARNNGSGWYQYDDLYLCSSKRSAMNYAQKSYAGGETGLMAYRLIQGADIICFDNYSPDSNIKQVIESIKDFAKEGNERPAIVTIDDVDLTCLSFEDGKPLEKDDIEDWFEYKRKSDYKFRYTKQIELRDYKVENLDKELFKKIIEEEK